MRFGDRGNNGGSAGRRYPLGRISLVVSFAATAGLASAACASLGDKIATIEADRAHFSATMRTNTASGATIHTLSSQTSGVTVKEFADTRGTVFAVSWSGVGRPDLRQLLGRHFVTMTSAMRRPGRRRMQRLATVRRSDLVVISQGHPGAFFGVAYDPGLVPAGFSLDALR
jgi:hypothetical protein